MVTAPSPARAIIVSKSVLTALREYRHASGLPRIEDGRLQSELAQAVASVQLRWLSEKHAWTADLRGGVFGEGASAELLLSDRGPDQQPIGGGRKIAVSLLIKAGPLRHALGDKLRAALPAPEPIPALPPPPFPSCSRPSPRSRRPPGTSSSRSWTTCSASCASRV